MSGRIHEKICILEKNDFSSNVKDGLKEYETEVVEKLS